MEHLIAPCGMNCALCFAYQRKKKMRWLQRGFLNKTSPLFELCYKKTALLFTAAKHVFVMGAQITHASGFVSWMRDTEKTME